MLQPLNVLLQQQQLVRAQAKLQGSLVRGEEGYARKSVGGRRGVGGKEYKALATSSWWAVWGEEGVQVYLAVQG